VGAVLDDPPEGLGHRLVVFVDYYEYTVDGEQTRSSIRVRRPLPLWPRPDNPRRGSSPLRSVLREVFTDNEAADFTASLLRNMGVPGLLVSPETGVTISDEDAQQTKTDLKEKFSRRAPRRADRDDRRDEDPAVRLLARPAAAA
jgi:hypothetical protein